MSRRAHPKEAVAHAQKLRSRGLPYATIAQDIYARFGISVGESTVRDWVKYRTRIA